MAVKLLLFVVFLASWSLKSVNSCPVVFKGARGKSFKIGEINIGNCKKMCQGKVIYHQTMTPTWLQAHASFINSRRTSTADQLTFTTGSVPNAALLKVPLISAGYFKKPTPLTIEITVAMDVKIGSSGDSDIIFGVSDGTKFVGFMAADTSNYVNHAPCFGFEGIPGSTLTQGRMIRKTAPRTSDSFYPGQFVFTLKLDESRGYCYTAHDGGYVKTDGYTNELSLSKGLTLEAYKDDDAGEKYGIKLIKVAITQDEA